MLRPFLAPGALCALVAPALADDPPPNILIVLADDVGTDSVGCYAEGQDLPNTPVIDALAADGLLFRNAWAHPSCTPARAALMTGRYGFRTGMGSPVEGDGHALQASETTLPELFDLHPELGYSNAYFGKWHLDNGTQGGLLAPNVAGWSHYAGWLYNLDAPQESYFDWPLVVDGALSDCQDYLTSKTVDLALEWIGQISEPWLCVVAFHAAHFPYHAPPAHLHTVDLPDVDPREEPRPFYRAIVEAMDTELGRLVAGLGEQRDRTTIVFASDNGTTKEVVVPPFLPGHAKRTPYEGGVGVPLIVNGPLVAAPGRESSHVVNLADVYATAAGLAGIDAAASLQGVTLDACSFLPAMLDPAAQPARRRIFSERFAPNGFMPSMATRMARDSRYKLIRRELPTPRLELYDLLRDPYELDDLMQHPVLVPEAGAALVGLLEFLEESLD